MSLVNSTELRERILREKVKAMRRPGVANEKKYDQT